VGFRFVTADLFPARPELAFARQWKAVLRQFRRAEAGEPRELFLFRGDGCAAARFERLGEADRGDVVFRARVPSACKTTIALQLEVRASALRRGGRSRRVEFWFG